MLPLWLLPGTWLLAPQDGSSLGNQVLPFRADHRAVLCLPGAWAPETGCSELRFILRGVLILRSESLACVCLSCVCLSDTRVLRGVSCGSLCSGGQLWPECLRLDLSEFLMLEQFSWCHLKLFPGHRAVFLKAETQPAALGAWSLVALVGE